MKHARKPRGSEGGHLYPNYIRGPPNENSIYIEYMSSVNPETSKPVLPVLPFSKNCPLGPKFSTKVYCRLEHRLTSIYNMLKFCEKNGDVYRDLRGLASAVTQEHQRSSISIFGKILSPKFWKDPLHITKLPFNIPRGIESLESLLESIWYQHNRVKELEVFYGGMLNLKEGESIISPPFLHAVLCQKGSFSETWGLHTMMVQLPGVMGQLQNVKAFGELAVHDQKDITEGMRKASDILKLARTEFMEKLEIPEEVLVFIAMNPIYSKTPIPIVVEVALKVLIVCLYLCWVYGRAYMNSRPLMVSAHYLNGHEEFDARGGFNQRGARAVLEICQTYYDSICGYFFDSLTMKMLNV